MLVRGTRVNPRGPRPERFTSPALDATVIGPTRQPTLFHHIACMCIIDSAVPESTSITCLGD